MACNMDATATHWCRPRSQQHAALTVPWTHWITPAAVCQESLKSFLLQMLSMRRVCVPQRYECFRFAVRKSQHLRRKSICKSGRHFCSCIRQFVLPIILTAVLIPLLSLGAMSNPQPSTESTPLVLCTGAMSNRHVPTGDTSLISLNAARGQGIPAIP